MEVKYGGKGTNGTRKVKDLPFGQGFLGEIFPRQDRPDESLGNTGPYIRVGIVVIGGEPRPASQIFVMDIGENVVTSLDPMAEVAGYQEVNLVCSVLGEGATLIIQHEEEGE